MDKKLKFLSEGVSFCDEYTKNIIKFKLSEVYFTITINDKTYFFTLKDDGRCFFDGTEYCLMAKDVSTYPTLNDLSSANIRNDGKPCSDNEQQNREIVEQIKNDLTNQ